MKLFIKHGERQHSKKFVETYVPAVVPIFSFFYQKEKFQSRRSYDIGSRKSEISVPRSVFMHRANLLSIFEHYRPGGREKYRGEVKISFNVDSVW